MTGTASEVLKQDLGLFISSWYSIAIAVFVSASSYAIISRPLKKRCRILHAGGLGVSPSSNKSPKIGGLGG